MALRIATFNAENILRRIDFSGFRNLIDRDRTLQMLDVASEEQYRQLEQARIVAHTDDKMQLTALAIADCRADILCLQEVEDLEALDAFEYGYLYRTVGRGFTRKYLVEGNDGRGIDVAVMTRSETAEGDAIEFISMKSHAAARYDTLGIFDRSLEEAGERPDGLVFRRDCLEIDLAVGGRRLTLFVVHFKSMGPGRNGVEGRDWTMPVRRAEALAVRRIIEEKFGAEASARRRWLICGDFNDYRERVIVRGSRDAGYAFEPVTEDRSGFDPLLAGDFAIDFMQRRDRMDRWTLYYAGGSDRQHLCQLDYILGSPKIAASNGLAVPDIVRAGQPWRTPFPPGQEVERYPRIGWDRPKSSDHCPVAITLNIV